jgi:hypothetical protein
MIKVLFPFIGSVINAGSSIEISDSLLPSA